MNARISKTDPRALERSRRWKQRNRERVAGYQHDWYEAHREERRE